MFKKFLAFMDGKKTWTGAAVIAAPTVVASVAEGIRQAGGDPVEVTRIAGTIVLVLGILHKVVKFLDDLTSTTPPEAHP